MIAHEEFRCHHCTELIGVYEPIVVLHNGIPVRTSRAASESGQLAGEAFFHAACFAARRSPPEHEDS